jgi:hypothetical protein
MKGIIILAIALAVGYYAYKGITGADERPGCQETFNMCMKTCRRTTSEAPAAQACQEACRAKPTRAAEREGEGSFGRRHEQDFQSFRSARPVASGAGPSAQAQAPAPLRPSAIPGT